MDDGGFTMYDSLRACLPCFGSSSAGPADSSEDLHNANHTIRQGRMDELEGLLAESTDTEGDIDAMSLHSNFGAGAGRSKRKPKKLRKKQRGGGLQLFGINLFGRPVAGAIQLPEGHDEPLDSDRRRPSTSSSSFTAAPDAVILESSAIEGLSSPPDPQAEPEDERAAEARHQRRRERKELKRAARELALNAGDGEFEGFPGSGGAGDASQYPQMPHFSIGGNSYSAPADSREEGFGPFRQAKQYQEDDADADDADLGGELYTRRTTGGTSHESDSRSRTSGSQSQGRAPPQYQYLGAGPQQYYDNGQPSPRLVPLPRSHSDGSSLRASSLEVQPRRKKSKKSTRSKSSTTSASSPSLPSPISTSFAAAGARVYDPSFEGYPGDEPQLDEVTVVVERPKLPSFPSSGLGGGARGSGRDMGTFLASR